MFYMHLILGARNSLSTHRTFAIQLQRETLETKSTLHVDVLDLALSFLTGRRDGGRRRCGSRGGIVATEGCRGRLGGAGRGLLGLL